MSRVVAIHPGAELYGSDRMFAESVRGFVEAGHDVLAVVAQEGPLRAQLEGVGARVEIAAAPVLRKSAMRPRGFAALLGSAAREVPKGWRLLRAARPDLVYVSTITVPSWLALGRLTGARVVAHVHEAEATASRALRLGLYSPLLLADQLIANSGFTADVVRSIVPRLGQRILVVVNGVAGPPVGPTPLRSQPDGGVRLLFVGRLSPRKGPDVALAATRLLRDQGLDARLTLVGSVFPGYEWFEEQLRADAGPLLDEGVVTLRGFTEDIWSEQAEADIVLVPSVLPESFGNAAVEAILAGRPVVASRIGGLPEAVAGARSARLAEPGSAASLAEQVTSLVESRPELAAQTDEARRWAEETFSPETYRRRVAALSFGGRP